MTSVRELQEQNAALLQQLFDREVADAERAAQERSTALTAANARADAEHAAANAAKLEEIRQGAWMLHLLDQQSAAGNGSEPFTGKAPESGWPPGQDPATFGLVVATAQRAPEDISNTPIMKRILAARGGKL